MTILFLLATAAALQPPRVAVVGGGLGGLASGIGLRNVGAEVTVFEKAPTRVSRRSKHPRARRVPALTSRPSAGSTATRARA